MSLLNRKKVIWEPQEGSQKLFLSCPTFECLIHGNRGGGKQLRSDENVLTKDGWKKISSLRIGELVYNRLGELYPVMGVFPQGFKRVYRIKLEDGREIDAGKEHLWIALCNGVENVFSTQDMLYSDCSFYIPYCIPIEFSDISSKGFDIRTAFYSKVISVEKTRETADMTCIAIASPDHTFITKDFIVTHNTDVLLMDYLQGVGRGWRAEYRGLLLREATTELGDVIAKCKKWIPQIFPDAKYNASKKIWTFADGESLWLNYAKTEEDYWQYHGHSFCLFGDSSVIVNGRLVKARDVKVGDFIQTLNGMKKVTKIIRDRKYPVKVSVLDEDSGLIYEQLQGLIHPLLTTYGWHRIGLSCLFQTSEQSVIGKHYLREVSQFLFGVCQEILVALSAFSSLASPSLLSSTFVSLPKWYSCLSQMLQQFFDLIVLSSLEQESPLCACRENLFYAVLEKGVGIFDKEFQQKHPRFLQLLYFCVFLINLVLSFHQVCIRLLQSILCREVQLLPSLYLHLPQAGRQWTSLSGINPLQVLSHELLSLGNFLLNGSSEYADCLIQEEPNCLGGCSSYSHPNDVQLLRVSGIGQVSFPLQSDALPCLFDMDVKGNEYEYSHHKPRFVYKKPYLHEPSETEFSLSPCRFFVSPCFSPVDVVDFEVEDERNYLSLATSIDNDKSQAIILINQNSWIGWEELTNWPTPDIYLKLMSCSRTVVKDMPLKYRATCNPAGSGHCVPFGEILTPSGWVDIKNVRVGDIVFSVDSNGMLVEKPVTQVHKDFYDGDLVEVDKRGFYLCCTPNHKLPKLGGVVGDRQKKFTLLEFQELSGEAPLLRTVDFRGNVPSGKFIVPDYDLKKIRKSRVIQPKECEWHLFAKLLGWFLSEGGVQKHQNSFNIAKCKNTRKEQYQEIYNLLTDIGFKFTSNDSGFTVYSRDWFQFFLKFGSYEDKYIPQEYKNWSKDLLFVLFTALVDGDGSWEKKPYSGVFYSTSKRLCEDVGEIALKLGYIILFRKKKNEHKRNCYWMYFHKNKSGCSVVHTGNHRYHVDTNSKRIDTTIKKYNGYVYCIGVPDTHTFILRQRGSVFVSGNSWVKQRFIDAVPEGTIYTDEHGQTRTHISSSLFENKILLEADPLYPEKILAMTEGNEQLRDAWFFGSWDLAYGDFFGDVWDAKIHVLKPFDPPPSWACLRSFDWGSARPWCVTYGWDTNGEQPEDDNVPYLPPNSVIIPTEIYGWTGTPNEGDRATSPEIAERVLAMDERMLKEYKLKVIPGPADTAIWEVRDGSSIAARMANAGCRWTRAYKGSGSRVAGWAIIRQMLKAAKKGDLENPHLYFFPAAINHIRTIPLLQRDKKKPEDVFTDSEDHAGDSLRYMLSRKMLKMKRRKVGI